MRSPHIQNSLPENRPTLLLINVSADTTGNATRCLFLTIFYMAEASRLAFHADRQQEACLTGNLHGEGFLRGCANIACLLAPETPV